MSKKIHITVLALATVLAAGATAAEAGILLNGLHPNAAAAGAPSLQTLAQNPIASKADGN